MEALKILEAISPQMGKPEILAAVEAAKGQLDLMSIRQVAERMGEKVANIRGRAKRAGIGHQIVGLGWVFCQADVEALRSTKDGRTRPGTKAKIRRVKVLYEDGLTNWEISKETDIHPSYVSRLLKRTE